MLEQALAGQNHFHFAGADAKCDGPECTMRGRMAVSANDGLSGQGDPHFGTDDMYDSMIFVGQVEQLDPVFTAILRKLFNLEP